jgi:hypothetical protein
VPALFGHGLAFDGAAFCSGRRSINMSGDTPFTFVVWVKFANVAYGTVLMLGDSSTDELTIQLLVGGGGNNGDLYVNYGSHGNGTAGQ